MKNHIAFKFLAILLCAAALLGAVGSGIGVLLLTEMDLYNTTVEEFCAQRLNSDSITFAYGTLNTYAEQNLGDFPVEATVQTSSYIYSYDPFPVNSVNYQILDAEGNVVEEEMGVSLKDPVTYTFPASGTYRKVQSIVPVKEEPSLDIADLEEMVVIDNIPKGETVAVYGISIGVDGGTAGVDSVTTLGFIRHKQDGTVFFTTTSYSSLPDDLGIGSSELLTDICFLDGNGNIIYEAIWSAGVGILEATDDGSFTFTSFVEPNNANSDTYTVNYLPQGKNVLVSGMEVSWDGGSTALSAGELGYLCRYEDGTVGFSATGLDRFDAGDISLVTYICFTDENGDILYTASDPDGVGNFFYNSRGTFCFQSVSGAGSGTVGTVNTYVNAYQEPDLTSGVVSSLGTGFAVEISKTRMVDDVEWGYIDDIGWVMMDQVTLGSAEPATASARSLVETTAPEETAATEETVFPTTTEETVFPDIAEDTTPTLAPTEEPTIPATAETAKESDEPTHTVDYWDSETQQYMRITYTQATMPEYTLVLYLEKDLSVYFPYYAALEMLWGMRNDLYQILIGGLLLFAVLAVYLCCAAGRKPGSEEVHPAGFNVLPLDLYLVAGGGGILGLLLLVDWASYSLMEKNWETCVGFGLCAAYVGCLIFVAFCYACAAQFKAPGGYWWRNTLCVRVPVGCWKLCRWFAKLFPWLGRVLIWCWKLVARVWNWAWGIVKGFFRWCYRKLNQFLKLLPLTWQWLLAGSAIFLLLLMAIANHGLTTVLCLAGCVAIILYGAHCFGILAESAKRMSKGDLDIQVEDPWMLGAFQEFAQDLNGLAGVAVVAAQKQLKSERMKTELITNVSHDIKTPLTSIINYVDLLQKPHTEEEGKQYLEVLDRQSQRLKKLIEDLMEMSKANTGNMAVDIKPLDAVEAVNQALGEFADKLEKAQLQPVFRRPEEPVTMLADGRLTWRVLSNLLGNAVKYALPGTRLYIDLMVLEGKVVLSLKNISREELNMEADELMERFVRGDSSRNTEGSGLGLNIAKSLMELQKGSLQLLVDGDLFKVTLIFPAG